MNINTASEPVHSIRKWALYKTDGQFTSLRRRRLWVELAYISAACRALLQLIITQWILPLSSTATSEADRLALQIICRLLLCVASATVYTFALAALYSKCPTRTSTAFLIALATVFGFSRWLTESTNELFIVILPAGVNIAMVVSIVISTTWSGVHDAGTIKRKYEPQYALVGVLDEKHSDNNTPTYGNQGLCKVDMQVMKTTQMVLGEEHLDDWTSITNLASTYSNQGRWKEAEELEVQVMETRKRVLGQEHPDTLTSMANLVSTYRNQGRSKEAEELLVQIMETFKRVLGQEHPDTLTSMANFASTYCNQERLIEAEELEVQATEMCSRVLSRVHPDTLTSIANLVSTYCKQERWKDALKIEVKVVEARKRVLGQEHLDILTTMNNIVHTYESQGRIKEAVSVMAEVPVLRSPKIDQDQGHPESKRPAEHLIKLEMK